MARMVLARGRAPLTVDGVAESTGARQVFPSRTATWFSRQRDRLVGLGLLPEHPAPASYVAPPVPDVPTSKGLGTLPGFSVYRPDAYMWEQAQVLCWTLACDGRISAADLRQRLDTKTQKWRSDLAGFLGRQAVRLRGFGGAASRASLFVRIECAALGKDHFDTVRDSPDYILTVQGETQGIDIARILIGGC